ncbi:uncharacterized protein LDX57_008034 [Aspergillus melleus]|uniref:uncharacterized protein n=1 Tax=Aspergillus melleus TaxID=138277 RepID=UPI001E8CA15B|nr:uncharacterized protein LDX57_008034 [Aspergillus melleus]KAH8430370.1 hypothetical protein LDX57_008034 [Aspergillus melleus]
MVEEIKRRPKSDRSIRDMPNLPSASRGFTINAAKFKERFTPSHQYAAFPKAPITSHIKAGVHFQWPGNGGEISARLFSSAR